VISLFVWLLYLGTAKRICAKFTVQTCLIRRSDVFEYQGQGSKVKVTRDKNALSSADTPVRSNGMRSLKTACSSSGRAYFLAARECFRGLACGVCLVKHL